MFRLAVFCSLLLYTASCAAVRWRSRCRGALPLFSPYSSNGRCAIGVEQVGLILVDEVLDAVEAVLLP